MLVVDRRDDPGAYAPGANRAEVQAALEREHFPHPGALFESTALPARVEVERPPPHAAGGDGNGGPGGGAGDGEGVLCVVATPGKDALVRLLFARVWGVEAA